MDYSLIWAVIIIFGIMMYVIMDGYDLGIGILFPLMKSKQDRDVMMNTVAPVWDGNETWLVMGGAGLFGAFPLAYAIVLDALALPITVMVIALVFRGVAFEFRFKATADKQHIWDKAFIGGSLVATFCQGVVIGAFLNGFSVVDRTYVGGRIDWLTPFPVFCGLALIVAYALLGCTWLIMKTEGALMDRMYKLAKPLTWALLGVIAVVSLWTPLTHSGIAERWFTLPNFFWLSPIPLLVVLITYAMIRTIDKADHYMPFILTLALVFLGYLGLGVSIWPYILPPNISIWEAAAPPQSQAFMLVGAVIIIPIILIYTAWSYYVFRGKVTHEEGYH